MGIAGAAAVWTWNNRCDVVKVRQGVQPRFKNDHKESTNVNKKTIEVAIEIHKFHTWSSEP